MVHMLEIGLLTSTAWLAYVTQFPYHVRRRHVTHVRNHAFRVCVLCHHHGKWLLWQVTVLLPRKREGEVTQDQ